MKVHKVDNFAALIELIQKMTSVSVLLALRNITPPFIKHKPKALRDWVMGLKQDSQTSKLL